MIAYKYKLRPDLKHSNESVFLRNTGVQFHRQAAAVSKLLSPLVTSLVQGSLRHTTLCKDLFFRILFLLCTVIFTTYQTAI